MLFLLLISVYLNALQYAEIFGNTESLGYYYINIWLGTPLFPQTVILDTGSRTLSIPCSDCSDCGVHMLPYFPYKASSTSRYITCSEGLPCKSCNERKCWFSHNYAEGSSLTGILIEDLYMIGNDVHNNIQVRGVIGCHMQETNLFYTQKANGIMGLAPSEPAKMNFMELINRKGGIQEKIFSICLGPAGGIFTVGGYNTSLHTEEVKWGNMWDKKYYAVLIRDIFVDKHDTLLNLQDFSNIYTTGSIIDSGTTFTYLNEKVYTSLIKYFKYFCSIATNCAGEAVTLPKEPNTCYKPNSKNETNLESFFFTFPDLKFVLEKEVITWKPRFYLFAWPETPSTYCLGIYTNGLNSGNVFGSNFMKGKDIIFQISSSKIGFAHSTCDSSFIQQSLDPSSFQLPNITSSGSKSNFNLSLYILLSIFSLYLAIYIYNSYFQRKRRTSKPSIQLTSV